jgi:hypothetical protein
MPVNGILLHKWMCVVAWFGDLVYWADQTWQAKKTWKTLKNHKTTDKPRFIYSWEIIHKLVDFPCLTPGVPTFHLAEPALPKGVGRTQVDPKRSEAETAWMVQKWKICMEN